MLYIYMMLNMLYIYDAIYTIYMCDAIYVNDAIYIKLVRSDS